MKLKEGFILREIAGETVVIPSGDALNLNMMITLNETGALLWRKLAEGADEDELCKALLAEYEVDEATASAHVSSFVKKLEENGFLD